ncbi:Cytochrome c oxidase subunit 8A, mitochondrial [Collichthys lucidus]|uniref:Cytochrome c oxidase subunit 8A, mitochondrial n=1 Tax=Collichthys lucidus TaxID=240159 RepID=A0A4U5TUS6_COLLU|nr:Cytochrome c oxidase subunit 8A, mitochondrial [Collichthys lucidus]TKS65100.1 Cytochrome c oxidase subunit 8A, mitochondrial [Collichthys lucidus]
MVSAVLRMMGNVSVSTLTRPKEILKDSKKMIYSKPPRNKIGAVESFFIMSVFAVAMLTPAAWILHHLPEYHQRSKPSPKT